MFDAYPYERLLLLLPPLHSHYYLHPLIVIQLATVVLYTKADERRFYDVHLPEID